MPGDLAKSRIPSFVIPSSNSQRLDILTESAEGTRKGPVRTTEDSGFFLLCPGLEGTLNLVQKARAQERSNERLAGESLVNLWDPRYAGSYPVRSLWSWLRKQEGTEVNSKALNHRQGGRIGR